jgi:hypothetical protein
MRSIEAPLPELAYFQAYGPVSEGRLTLGRWAVELH